MPKTLMATMSLPLENASAARGFFNQQD